MSLVTHNIQAFGMPGGWEWIIVLVVALLIFGRKLPEVARNIGKSLTEFKRGIKEAEDVKDEIQNDVDNVKNDIAKEARDAAGLNDSDKS